VKASALKPEVEFRRFFKISFWGHIVVADQDIFTKLGVCEDNGAPQSVEWICFPRKSKMADGGQVQ